MRILVDQVPRVVDLRCRIVAVRLLLGRVHRRLPKGCREGRHLSSFLSVVLPIVSQTDRAAVLGDGRCQLFLFVLIRLLEADIGQIVNGSII